MAKKFTDDDIVEEIQSSLDANNFDELEDDNGFYNKVEDVSQEAIENEDQINMDFLKNIQENTQRIIQMKENEGDIKKKKKGFFKFGKKKQAVIDLSGIEGNYSNDDVIIVGTDTKALKRATKTTFKTILSLVVIAILSVIVFLCLSYKLVPAKVIGFNYSLGDYSIVSNQNTPDLNAIKSGDKIIVNNKEWMPILVDFDLYVVKSRDGGLIYATNDQGYTETLESTEIDYILK